MTSTSEPLRATTLPPGEIFLIWARHLQSLIFPLLALAFLWTGPHEWWVGPFFLIPGGYLFYLDIRGTNERRQPVDHLPSWPFDLIVYALAGLQLVIVYELAVLFSTQAIFSVDMAMVFLLVGGNAGFSIITAHELIHRHSKLDQQIGRLLLACVLYEHFYTEHLRGHHVRVGTEEDPATAKFGETYREFWRRTVPGQFRSAWRLEAGRLGDPDMPLLDKRMLHNRMLHGIAVGWGIAFAILLGFGLASFVAHLLQAFFAVRLLEAVNYFEHWGLRRRERRVRPVDSWDTHSRFTYYGLVGLSRHADHHAYPARPYQQLRVFEEPPMLPLGYIGMVDMVLVNNDEFRRLATLELKRKELGPFAAEAEPDEIAAAEAAEMQKDALPAMVPIPLFRLIQGLPYWVRTGIVMALFLVAVTIGTTLEGGASVAFLPALLSNGWILAVFAGSLAIHHVLQLWTGKEALSWAAAFGALLMAGSLTSLLG